MTFQQLSSVRLLSYHQTHPIIMSFQLKTTKPDPFIFVNSFDIGTLPFFFQPVKKGVSNIVICKSHDVVHINNNMTFTCWFGIPMTMFHDFPQVPFFGSFEGKVTTIHLPFEPTHDLIPVHRPMCGA